jgi:hypothetical protein
MSADHSVGMEERRNGERREAGSPVILRLDETRIEGTIKNVSQDGALVAVVGAERFRPEDRGNSVMIEEADFAALPELGKRGKLVRIFDSEDTQFVALRFLDFLGT